MGATGYDVQRSTTAGGPYSQISSPTVPNFTDTGLTNGTRYFYVVSAFNSVGQSANSAEVNATPVPPPPATPTGLAAAAGNAQVSLNWNASTGAISYHVKRSTASGAETQISAPASNSFTDTGLTNGTKYFYVVSAVNSGGESANSSEVSATPTVPAAPPSTPTGLQATAGNEQVSLSWNASTGATSYHVKRSTASGSETQISAPASNSFTDTGLTNGIKYFLRSFSRELWRRERQLLRSQRHTHSSSSASRNANRVASNRGKCAGEFELECDHGRDELQ